MDLIIQFEDQFFPIHLLLLDKKEKTRGFADFIMARPEQNQRFLLAPSPSEFNSGQA